MKKEILLIKEKRERITIRRKHRGKKEIFICLNCGRKIERQTLPETSSIKRVNIKKA